MILFLIKVVVGFMWALVKIVLCKPGEGNYM